jgi:hypothetical protein
MIALSIKTPTATYFIGETIITKPRTLAQGLRDFCVIETKSSSRRGGAPETQWLADR